MQNNLKKRDNRLKKFSIQKFFERIKDPKERKFFLALFGGKMLGLAAAFAIILAVSAYLNQQELPSQCANASGGHERDDHGDERHDDHDQYGRSRY